MLVCFRGGGDVFILVLVHGVLCCHGIYYLNTIVVPPYDYGFRVGVYCLTRFNCVIDLRFRCGGLCGLTAIGSLMYPRSGRGSLYSCCGRTGFDVVGFEIIDGGDNWVPLLGWHLSTLVYRAYVDLL